MTYEPLPNVTDVESAMDPDAPVLHEHIKTDGLGTGQQTGTNIANHYEFVLGDVEIGFGQAEVIFEQEYNTKTVHQGYQNETKLKPRWCQLGCFVCDAEKTTFQMTKTTRKQCRNDARKHQQM